jgi:membrane protease YdiL (CAAX protease family)
VVEPREAVERRPKAVDARRTDPARDRRRLALYFIGLIAVYGVGAWALRPTEANGYSEQWGLAVMAAPTVGALLALFAGPAIIVWGRPSWWMLLGLLPAVIGLAVYEVAAAAGVIQLNPEAGSFALTSVLINVLLLCVIAAGEEIGWRGFLWPLVRRRLSFIPATLVVTAGWWLYHLPLILLGWYGSFGGIPAFTVMILGFGAFVGVITDRSRSIWPSVLAHGTWNALVATSFAVHAEGRPRFTGDPALLGEFGWIAAISTFVLGAAAVTWHLFAGGGSHMPYPRTTWTAAGHA